MPNNDIRHPLADRMDALSVIHGVIMVIIICNIYYND